MRGRHHLFRAPTPPPTAPPPAPTPANPAPKSVAGDYFGQPQPGVVPFLAIGAWKPTTTTWPPRARRAGAVTINDRWRFILHTQLATHAHALAREARAKVAGPGCESSASPGTPPSASLRSTTSPAFWSCTICFPAAPPWIPNRAHAPAFRVAAPDPPPRRWHYQAPGVVVR